MSEEADVEPESIRAQVALDRARGGRWRPTPEGSYRRLTSLEVLAERGLLTVAAVSGGHSYRMDYLASIEAASLRSTIYAKVGARDDEDEVLDRAFSATSILGRIHREVLTEPSIGRLVADLCGRDFASAALEKRAVAVGLSDHLESVERWYFRNDARGERDNEVEHMRLVGLEGWWVLAKAFNPRMSRGAFEHYWVESGMGEHQEMGGARAAAAAGQALYLRRRLDDADVDRRARELYGEFVDRFKVRASSWELLSLGEQRRWRDVATAEQERAA